MNIRQQREEYEKEYLSEFATLSVNSKGRRRPEPQCDIRPVFQRDRDRILHSKSFRRLKHKTQVFIAPRGDHYRTRLTHALEVSQIARTIARALRLNEDLAEAIALGHDIGHTPFGHMGERTLQSICPEIGFSHSKQSLRVVDVLEHDGEGLNLTWEVCDGILNHQTSGNPATLEGQTVKISDKIAYVNHDIDDAIRARIIKEADVPTQYREILGDTVKTRLDVLIRDVIAESQGKPYVRASEKIYDALYGMRRFMFERVYSNEGAVREEEKAKELISLLYDHYFTHTDELPAYLLKLMDEGERKERIIFDYIAGMSDSYAVYKFNSIYTPSSWRIY